jgi:antitoxin component YwqK of YwqJK toxin-antitoxin module
MKKTAYLLLVSTYLLNGCHSKTIPGNANQPSGDNIDTSQIHVTPPPRDTTIKNGQLLLRYPNGIIKEKSYYMDGRRHGECQSFYPDGKLWSDDYFTDGLTNGLSTVFYENGQKRYEGNFVNGKPAGTWNFWDEKGKLIRTITYGKGEKHPL